MAKGQQKSNKETRKPKQDKKVDKTPSPIGSQVKQAESTMAKRKP